MAILLFGHTGCHCFCAYLSPWLCIQNEGTFRKHSLKKKRGGPGVRTQAQMVLHLPISLSTVGLFPWWGLLVIEALEWSRLQGALSGLSALLLPGIMNLIWNSGSPCVWGSTDPHCYVCSHFPSHVSHLQWDWTLDEDSETRRYLRHTRPPWLSSLLRFAL